MTPPPTSTRAPAARLADLLEGAGVGWLLEGAEAQREQRLAGILAEVRAVETEYQRRFGRAIVLLDAMEADPVAMIPLVQTFALPMTAPIRTMVHCLVSGARIASLDYSYEAERATRLRVTVAFPDEQEEFVSTEHWDTEVLHHVGIAKLGGRPFLDGYYAFRK